jgi:hypothetical protein
VNNSGPWLGADPGGINSFGVARLYADGQFDTKIVSSVDEASTFIGTSVAVGIDCPMWWSSGRGGGRKVDSCLRQKYGIPSGTVQSVNSLKGAVVIQGILLAMKIREVTPNCVITETHPKALLRAMDLAANDWDSIRTRFSLSGLQPDTEHERDAIISAVVAREGMLGRWVTDLSTILGLNEINPHRMWFGKVRYWWPESILESKTR